MFVPESLVSAARARAFNNERREHCIELAECTASNLQNALQPIYLKFLALLPVPALKLYGPIIVSIA